MELKEQNWQKFCQHHLQDWHGLRTRYSFRGEVIDSSVGVRSFPANQQQTQITQTNSYYLDETGGKKSEKSWQIDKDVHNLTDGLFHPATSTMRGFFFPQGAAAWVTTQLKLGYYCVIELFLVHEHLRLSTNSFYMGNGEFTGTIIEREDAAGYPSKYWSSKNDCLPEQPFRGAWQGTSVTMTPDLRVSPAVKVEKFNWGYEGNESFFFPDRISVSCPDRVRVGSSFTIATAWLVTDSHMQQLIVKYDGQGTFRSVTLELLHAIG